MYLFESLMLHIYFTLIKRKIKYGQRIIIYDIDNTVANTFQFIIDNGYIDFKKLSIFEPMKKKILSEMENDSNLVLFFSARPLKSYLKTLTWLKGHGILKHITSVYLFKSPMHKVKMIEKMCLNFSSKIIFFDDMSYNHENGEIKYYKEAIKKIQELPIDYVDYSTILNFQKSVWTKCL